MGSWSRFGDRGVLNGLLVVHVGRARGVRRVGDPVATAALTRQNRLR